MVAIPIDWTEGNSRRRRTTETCKLLHLDRKYSCFGYRSSQTSYFYDWELGRWVCSQLKSTQKSKIQPSSTIPQNNDFRKKIVLANNISGDVCSIP